MRAAGREALAFNGAENNQAHPEACVGFLTSLSTWCCGDPIRMPSSRGSGPYWRRRIHDAKDSERETVGWGSFPGKLIREKAIAAEKWVEQPTIEEANEMVHQRCACLPSLQPHCSRLKVPRSFAVCVERRPLLPRSGLSSPQSRRPTVRWFISAAHVFRCSLIVPG